MAWLYNRSSTWRRIVHATQRSPLTMAVFGATCMVAVPYLVASGVQGTSNSPTREGELEARLRAQGGMQAQVLARAQKERLQVLLDEIKEGGGQERYKAALDGQSLGTHSTGSSAGAVAITRGDPGSSNSNGGAGR